MKPLSCELFISYKLLCSGLYIMTVYSYLLLLCVLIFMFKLQLIFVNKLFINPNFSFSM